MVLYIYIYTHTDIVYIYNLRYAQNKQLVHHCSHNQDTRGCNGVSLGEYQWGAGGKGPGPGEPMAFCIRNDGNDLPILAGSLY